MNGRRTDYLILCFVLAIVGCLLLWGMTGCTVTPDILPPAAVASYDGNVQNSGFLGWASDGSGVITAHARDRYNALLAQYKVGVKDEGLTPMPDGSWLIDKQHLVLFSELNRKAKSAWTH